MNLGPDNDVGMIDDTTECEPLYPAVWFDVLTLSAVPYLNDTPENVFLFKELPTFGRFCLLLPNVLSVYLFLSFVTGTAVSSFFND
jgi:hypothetical protein